MPDNRRSPVSIPGVNIPDIPQSEPDDTSEAEPESDEESEPDLEDVDGVGSSPGTGVPDDPQSEPESDEESDSEPEPDLEDVDGVGSSPETGVPDSSADDSEPDDDPLSDVDGIGSSPSTGVPDDIGEHDIRGERVIHDFESDRIRAEDDPETITADRSDATDRQRAVAEEIDADIDPEAVVIEDGQFDPDGTIRRQQALEFDQRTPIEVTQDDVRVEETDDGLRPELRDDAVDRLAQQQGIEVDGFGRIGASGIAGGTVEDGAIVPELTDDARETVERAQALDELQDQTATNIGPSDLEQSDDGFRLSDEVQEEEAIAEIASETDLTQDEIAGIERGEIDDPFTPAGTDRAIAETVDPILTEDAQVDRARETLGDQDTPFDPSDVVGVRETDDGEVIPEIDQQAQREFAEQQAADQVERELFADQMRHARDETQVRAIAERGPPDIDAGEDVIANVSDGDIDFRLSEDFRENLALDELRSDTGIDFREEDIDADGTAIELTESGEDRIERQAEREIISEFEEETGADFGPDDIELEETEDGEFEAQLTGDGEETLAVEQQGGTDLPVVGGVFEAGARADIRTTQTLEDIGPDFSIPSPDIGDVLPAGAVVGGTASGAAGASLGAAAAGTGIGAALVGGAVLSTDPLSDSARRDRTADTAQIGIGTGIIDQELEISEDLTDQTELDADQQAVIDQEISVPTQTAIQSSEVDVPTGNIFTSELDVSRAVSEGTESSNGEPSDDTVVPDEFPLAGRDIPADPEREFVDGESGQAIAGTSPVGQELSQRQERQEEDESDLGPPDDPFLESDRRLRDQRREFGDREDISRSVDPTSETIESRRDIGEGIAGTGSSFEPARAETVEENFQRFLQEEQQRIQQAQEQRILQDDSVVGEVDLAEGTTESDGTLRESQRSEVVQDTPLSELFDQASIATSPDLSAQPFSDSIGDVDSRADERADIREDTDLQPLERFDQQQQAATQQVFSTQPQISQVAESAMQQRIEQRFESRTQAQTLNPTSPGFGTGFGPGFGTGFNFGFGVPSGPPNIRPPRRPFGISLGGDSDEEILDADEIGQAWESPILDADDIGDDIFEVGR